MRDFLLKRLLAAGALIGVTLFAPTGANAAGPAAQAIEQRLTAWTENFNAGRAEAACDLFAPDLIANDRGQPEKNFDSLCSGLHRDLAGGPRDFRYRLELNEIIVSGDLAAVRLIWHLAVTEKSTGATFQSSDRGIDIFRLQPDGKWRIVRYITYEIG